MRWPGDTAPEATLHITPDLVVEALGNRRERAPDRHEVQTDFQAPLAALVAERIESDHVDRVEGTLLALTAASLARPGSHEGVEECLRAAEQYRTSLSPRTRASVELTRNATDEEFEVTEGALRELEEVGLRDADHPDLWNFLVLLAYFGGLEGSVSLDDRLRYAVKAVEAAPENPTARYNLAETYMAAQRPDEALAQFEIVAQDPAYSTHYYVHLSRGILLYNKGDFEAARDAYQLAVRQHPTAESHLFLGDAYRQAGEQDAAREQYRLALHAEPTLVDAHRGYWHVLRPGQAAESTSPLFDAVYMVIARLPRWRRRWQHRAFGWWLRRHYRRHPEDTRIHFMLGAHALLQGDLETAEERLRFAVDVFDGVDYEALSRLAIVHGLQGCFDEARAELEGVRDIPSLRNSATPAPPSVQELRERAVNFLLPFVDEPHLASGEKGARLFDVFAEVFEPVVGPIPELMQRLNSPDEGEG
jgi:tetratricopeptide (TPR) repeat protein